MLELQYSVERNPVITVLVNGEIVDKILFIGDPHLGRRFVTGVPSHRIGDREAYMYSQFSRLLNTSYDPLITKVIIPGDLFDKFIVSPTVVLDTFNILRQVDEDVDVFIIPGNHDLSKDTTKTSSFQLLTHLIQAKCSNVKVFQKSEVHSVSYNNSKDVLNLYFDCYNPFSDCVVEEDLKDLSDKSTIISVGHWDSLSILDKGYTPHQDILTYSNLVVSGHEHTYREYTYPFDKSKTKVLFTGSMQPYSHAEDPDKDIYMTVKDKELVKYDLTKDFLHKCIRVECGPYYVLPESVECFSLTYKVVVEEKDDIEIEEDVTDIDGYNDLLKEWVKSNKDLSKEIQKELSELLENKEYLI